VSVALKFDFGAGLSLDSLSPLLVLAGRFTEVIKAKYEMKTVFLLTMLRKAE